MNVTKTLNLGLCGSYPFTDLISVFGISPGNFTAEGDSGAALLDSTTRTPIGLMFGADSHFSYANPFSDVASLLDISPVGLRSAHGPESVQRIADSRLDQLKEIQARHEKALLSIKGVEAIGIGLADDGHGLAFHLYVGQRTREIESSIPTDVEGVPVRLLQTGEHFSPDGPATRPSHRQ